VNFRFKKGASAKDYKELAKKVATLCVCVCVCVRERERESERECVYVYVCVYVCVFVSASLRGTQHCIAAFACHS
jgi:hypothetical protein